MVQLKFTKQVPVGQNKGQNNALAPTIMCVMKGQLLPRKAEGHSLREQPAVWTINSSKGKGNEE